MSNDSHHAIVVTTWSVETAGILWNLAHDIWRFDDGKLSSQVSLVQESPINQRYSFFIGPDGAFENREDSHEGDRRRTVFIEHLRTVDDCTLSWAEVRFGDDATMTCSIERNSDEH